MRFLIAILILVSLFTGVRCINAESNEISNNDNGSTSVELYTTIESSYTVKLPKYIDVTNNVTTFDVFVKGNIAGDEFVNINVKSDKLNVNTDVDIDGDGIPDINIDTNNDGVPDINIDIDGDGKPDINIDTDGTGEWKPSGDGGNDDGIWKPDTNIDTDGDGKPDTDDNQKPVDNDKDGVDDNWKPNTIVELKRLPGTEIIIHDDDYTRPHYNDDSKDEEVKEYTTAEKTKACIELLGKGWRYSEKNKSCIYSDDLSNFVPGTSTK